MDYTRRLYDFYDEIVRPYEEAGATVYHEYELREEIAGEKFVGYVDLLIEEEQKVHIVDFKTAKKVQPLTYTHQLMLYAYLYGVRRGWNTEETADRVTLSVFFPLGGLPTKYEGSTTSQLYKTIDYSKNGLDGILEGDIKVIREIMSTDWDEVGAEDGNYDFSCLWCPYAGSLASEDGFPGCKQSYQHGKRMIRGTVFTRRDP
jgi:hypothetical protein